VNGPARNVFRPFGCGGIVFNDILGPRLQSQCKRDVGIG
jgi:hypothetical protein